MTSFSQPELSIGLSLDESDYPSSSPVTIHARLTIRNWSAEPVTLKFLTSQNYDFEIHDDQGKVVYLWSKARAFSQAIAEVQIQYEKEFAFTAQVGVLAPGRYVAQAWLASEGPPRTYSASTRFHVQ